jgi:hypothetical protein
LTLREWELTMLAAGASRVRVYSTRKGEYTAEAVVAKGLIAVTGEDMDSARARLLERCQGRP